MPRITCFSRYELGNIVQIVNRLPQPRPTIIFHQQSIATRFQSSLATATARREEAKSSSGVGQVVGNISVTSAASSGYVPVASLQTIPSTNSIPDERKSMYRFIGRPKSAPLAPPIDVSKRRMPPRETIIPPSKASGGVPDPTPEYLSLACATPRTLPEPRKILVILDLNGTLLHRPNRMYASRFIERPYTRTFLEYCIKTFTVAFWSSTRPENIKKMLAQLLTPELRSQVVAVWGRDKFGLTPDDYRQRVQCYKRLSFIWDAPEIAAAHPDFLNGGRWSQKDTVLVDDSSEKSRSEPYNLLEIPEFAGDTYEPNFILPQVHDYLNECSRQENVSAYMRANPFTVNPEFTL
ncbi:HAD-like domain-containing protein [Biscogniauxia mediterranea]|nr:HAD-like domain-containing protein [Biscogniauxia mediterranea]